MSEREYEIYDEPDSCRYCGIALYQEEVDRGLTACADCIDREGPFTDP